MNVQKQQMRYLTHLETLYVIGEAQGLHESGEPYPYTYRDGKEMSTRDIVRYETSKLQRRSDILGIWGANNRIKTLLTFEGGPLIVETDRTYAAYATPKRIIYELTVEGSEYLAKHLKDLQEFYGDRLKELGKFSEEEKIKLMPEMVVMINT